MQAAKLLTTFREFKRREAVGLASFYANKLASLEVGGWRASDSQCIRAGIMHMAGSSAGVCMHTSSASFLSPTV